MTIYTLETPASPDRPLEAPSLVELVELVELVGCALAAGDQIDRLAAYDGRGGRALTPAELLHVVAGLIDSG